MSHHTRFDNNSNDLLNDRVQNNVNRDRVRQMRRALDRVPADRDGRPGRDENTHEVWSCLNIFSSGIFD